MADDDVPKSLQEWNNIFKKLLGKRAGFCYRSFLLDIAVILLGFKPSLLFDYAVVDSKSAFTLTQLLRKGFAGKGAVQRSLNVLKVGEDIFFANLKILISHLRKSVESDGFILIDVSGKLQEPRVLENGIAVRVKEQFTSIIEILQQKLRDLTSNSTQGDDMEPEIHFVDLGGYKDESWCIPSVFGFLLGYPVIYWCDKASEDNCLSLVPLNRYTVTFKGSPSIFYSRMMQNRGRLFADECGSSQVCEHILFSFTAPTALECSYESQVRYWIKTMRDLGETLGITEYLTFQKTTVTLSQVSL